MSARDVFNGDEPGADVMAQGLLDDLREFVDTETVDGPEGLAWQWDKRLITVEELHHTVERYRKMKVLVGSEGGGRD